MSRAAMFPWDPPDLPHGDFFCVISWLLNDAFSKPQPRSAVSAAKGKVRMGGTLKGSHPAGLPGTLTLQLNGRAKRALLAAGKLNVTIRATISNAAGSTPFTGKLKLVAKSSK